MLFSVSVPAGNLRGPQYMEQVLAAIHQANPRRHPVTFIIAPHAKTVRLLSRVPPELEAALLGQLGAHYPDATIARLPDDALALPPGDCAWSVDLRLRPDIFPLRRYAQFEDPLNRNAADPLTALFAAFAVDLPEACPARIEITIRPASRRHAARARQTLRLLAHPFFQSRPTVARAYALAATSSSLPVRHAAFAVGTVMRSGSAPQPPRPASSARTHDREDDRQAAADKLGRHLFEGHVRLLAFAPPTAADRAHAQLVWLAGAFGPFTVPHLARFYPSQCRQHIADAPTPTSRGFLLSCEEVATLWHPATSTVRAPAMAVTASRELEPPVVLPSPEQEPELAVIGRTKFRSRRQVFGMRADDRRRHLAVIGKTGMGKTTLLYKLIASDIDAGRGLALLDPHGDLCDAVLASVPPRRTNHIVLFDVGDRAFPLAFNPLACKDPQQRPLVASGVVAAFKKLYGDSWGPRLEHILRNALLALLETPGVSLLSLQRLLSDAAYRTMLTSRLRDPVVRTFWQGEFASWKPQYQAEAIAPIQNKVGQFLSHPILRAIVGQARTSLDLRRVKDERRILLVNLSKGKIGEDGSTLLGSLLVTGIQLAAMSRADVPEEDRGDFHLYVDEFHQFATESFATILSEARKFRLSLTVATQYLAQMDEATAAAVFGNVGSLLVFQVGASDAEALADQLGGDVTPQDLLALPRFTACARLLIDGMPSRPFTMETLPPPAPRGHGTRSAVIRRTSRHRYSRPADEVQGEIGKALGQAV